MEREEEVNTRSSHHVWALFSSDELCELDPEWLPV
jgi:hypothetical protein